MSCGTAQCISINHNFASSPTLPQLYTALEQAQIRVEDSIADVKEMIQKRLGTQGIEWEKDWCEEVQGLLERDAGWGWRGFWEMVRDNMRVSASGRRGMTADETVSACGGGGKTE